MTTPFSKRSAIGILRDMLKERNADSTYSNQFLYNVLMEHARWLIKRDINSGRIYKNTGFFRPLRCQDIIEVSTIDECCPVKTNCRIFRTKHKMPEMWQDDTGPIIKTVTSVDGRTDFFVTTITTWENKQGDPYQQESQQKYTFYSDGYFWFPIHNPHKANILAFFIDDVSSLSGCTDKKPCVRFLDSEFLVPSWLHGEMFSKALEQIAGITKRLPEDEEINKNPSSK